MRILRHLVVMPLAGLVMAALASPATASEVSSDCRASLDAVATELRGLSEHTPWLEVLHRIQDGAGRPCEFDMFAANRLQPGLTAELEDPASPLDPVPADAGPVDCTGQPTGSGDIYMDVSIASQQVYHASDEVVAAQLGTLRDTHTGARFRVVRGVGKWLNALTVKWAGASGDKYVATGQIGPVTFYMPQASGAINCGTSEHQVTTNTGKVKSTGQSSQKVACTAWADGRLDVGGREVGLSIELSTDVYGAVPCIQPG